MQNTPNLNSLVQKQHNQFVQTCLKLQTNLPDYPLHQQLTQNCKYYNPGNFSVNNLMYWAIDLIRTNRIKLALVLREAYILAQTSSPIVKNLDSKMIDQFMNKEQVDMV